MDGLESEPRSPLSCSLEVLSHLKRREAKESCIELTAPGSGQLVQVVRYSDTGGLQLLTNSDPLRDPGRLTGPELRLLLATLSLPLNTE